MNLEKILVIDNLFDNKFIAKVEELFLSPVFKWELSQSLYTCPVDLTEKYKTKLKNLKEYILFAHDFYKMTNGISYKKSTHAYIADEIIDKIKSNLKIVDNIKILRAKANFQTQFTGNNISLHNTPHTDFINYDHTVIIYYVNNSDGKTLFFDKDLNIVKEVEPKAGRLLIFDGDNLHTSSNPVKSKYRFVINIDIKKFYD
jgi:hypothetical protein